MQDSEVLYLPLIPQPQRYEHRGGARRDGAHPAGEVIADLVEVTDTGVPLEGYRLEVRDGRAAVRASDQRGFRYARVTLAELAEMHDGQVPDASIEDEPVLVRRGIIEGFYGESWSHAERLAALRLAGR